MKYGFHVRRTMTPVQRQIRAVSLRHTPYHTKRSIPVPEVIHEPEEKVVTEIISKQTQIEPVQNQTTAEPEVRLSRRQKRKQKKEQMFEEQASQPYSTLSERIFHPFRSITRARQSQYIDITLIAALLAQFFKWILFTGIPAHVLQEAVTAHAFSYARMPFSTTAGAALLLALIGWCAEQLLFIVLSFGTFLHTDNQGYASIQDIRCHGLPSVLAMMIPCYIIALNNTAYGITALVVVFLFSVGLDLYALKTEGRKNTIMIWSAYGIGLACTIPLWMIGIQEIARQLAEILMIINL
ncbi:MAG: hypothetical protein ACI32N_03835 [Bulleidia sp.]